MSVSSRSSATAGRPSSRQTPRPGVGRHRPTASAKPKRRQLRTAEQRAERERIAAREEAERLEQEARRAEATADAIDPEENR